MAMRIHVDLEGTLAGLEALVEQAARDAETGHGLMLLACDGNRFPPDKVNTLLQRAKVPVIGGVFPAVIHGRQLLYRGTIAISLPVASESVFIPGDNTRTAHFTDSIERLFPESTAGQTMIVFVDGTACWIGPFIEGLFNVFGLDINYVGGGAGSIEKTRRPCLFSNSGMHTDGAVLMLLPCDSGVGVCHGWKEYKGPFQVTESHGNVIQSLDWRPAFEVYSEALDQCFDMISDEREFFEMSHAYPFGISRLGTEQIVRDILRVGDNNSLVCAGEVEEGSFVHLLQSDEQSLVAAAGMALERAHYARPSWRKEDLHLFIDCISRVLFLGSHFQKELDAVYCEGVPSAGACTIGEIANCRTEYLEFYNKTAVVAVLDSA